MNEEAQKGSAVRAIAVLRAVFNHGPITSSEIARLLGQSRTSVHRAVHVLIDNGLLRYQIGSKRVVVSGQLFQMCNEMEFAPTGLDSISNAINDTIKIYEVDFEVGAIAPDESGIVVESTLAGGTYIEPFFESDLACMILCQHDRSGQQDLVARALKREAIERPNFAFLDRLRDARENTKLWDTASQSVTLGLQIGSYDFHAMRILSQGGDRASWRTRCSDALHFFYQTLAGSREEKKDVA